MTTTNRRPRLLDKLRFKQIPYEGKKAALYVRVSKDEFILNESGEREERTSVTTQRDDAVEYAKGKKWAYEVYDQDSDISGFEDIAKRPGISKLLQDVRDGKIHTVVVREVKRLSRNQSQLSHIIN